jgi:hypothetical protein
MRKVNLLLKRATGATRIEMYAGKEHLVVPVVALMEGVVWPSNSDGPEFVPAEVLAFAPGSWDGRPVFCNHPVVEGVGSASQPGLLDELSFGQIFNTSTSEQIIETRKLNLEVWLDRAKAETVGEDAQRIITSLEELIPVGVSVGAYVGYTEQSGEWEGKTFKRSWAAVSPDHIAMLVEEVEGACSLDMGCGALLTAKQKELTVADEVKKKLPMLAGMKRAILEAIGLAARDEQSDTELRQRLDEQLRNTIPMYMGIEAVKPNMSPPVVIYATYANDRYALYQRTYKQSPAGAVTVNDDEAEVQFVGDYKPVLTSGAAAASAPTPCGCGGNPPAPARTEAAAHTEEDSNVDKKLRIANIIKNSKGRFDATDENWLLTVPEDRLTKLEAAEPTPAAEPPAPVVPAPAVEPKPQTAEEWMGAAPPEVASLVKRYQAAEAATKADLVKKLKTAQKIYSETDLTGMNVEQLEKIAQLANVTLGQRSDFTGIRVPELPQEDDPNTQVPAPRKLDAKIAELKKRTA